MVALLVTSVLVATKQIPSSELVDTVEKLTVTLMGAFAAEGFAEKWGWRK
jgi:hypothetical protein